MQFITISTILGLITATIAAPGNNRPPSQPDTGTQPAPRDTPPGVPPIELNLYMNNFNDGSPPSYNGGPIGQPYIRPWLDTSPSPAPSELSFYMCCQLNSVSPGIDHYYPPYACIFGPATGACPGVTSSFPYAWLCKYQPGNIGSLDCIDESASSASSVSSVLADVLTPAKNLVSNVLGAAGV